MSDPYPDRMPLRSYAETEVALRAEASYAHGELLSPHVRGYRYNALAGNYDYLTSTHAVANRGMERHPESALLTYSTVWRVWAKGDVHHPLGAGVSRSDAILIMECFESRCEREEGQRQ